MLIDVIDLSDAHAVTPPETRRPPPCTRAVQLHAADWSSFVERSRGQDLAPLPAESATIVSYSSASASRLCQGALARRAAAISDRHRQVSLHIEDGARLSWRAIALDQAGFAHPASPQVC